MDPTTRFFAQLKKLAVTLESETAKLQHAFENRHNEDDSESKQRGMRAYHELNCEVGDLKGQIQKQLAEHKAREKEVGNFITACKVMEQRLATDVQALKEYFQKYGYQPPQDSQKTSKGTNCQESDAENEVADEEAESKSAGEEGGSQEEEEGTKTNHPSSPPLGGPPPVTDFLRTPQLADFGLSEMQLKRALAGAAWCSEVPPMPQISLPQASVDTPAPPPMPLTPKCALRMDDDELLTPQMQAFGISEHTMCLINDFTMALFQKNIDKPQRPPQDIPEPVNRLMETLQDKENLESPEPPVFCTPGFKIKKTKSHCSPTEQISADPESPVQLGKPPTTPEIPVLQTPYLKHLVSSKKSARQPESAAMQTNDENHAPKLPTPAANGNTSGKRVWECNVPEISIQDLDDRQMPEMPNLESVLAKSLQSKNAKMLKKSSEHESVTKEPAVRSLEIDGPTQEFNFGTPRLRKDFDVPNTPEMPDLSSVTQDICKLVSQAQLKRTAMAVVQPNVREDKENISAHATVVSVPLVSESEFQSLPGYLRLMTLHNLNQAIHSINKFTADSPREKTEFQMEELRKITNVGAKTPVYILCLTELKRLVHVGGTKNASVYKLCTQN